MKGAAAVLSLAAISRASASDASPIGKVIQMISDLEAKILAEGEAAQKTYDEFAEWCSDESKNLGFEIKTGKGQVETLKATIQEEASNIESLTAKVEKLAETLATADADLKAAQGIRDKEAADFAASEKELEEVIDTLGRAIGILEKELAKGGAAMIQASSGVVSALNTLVQASALSSADGKRLTALLQSEQESDDSDDLTGAPAAAVYENKSGSIVDVLGDLQEKAQGQLDDARKKEDSALHNFAMLKQSLEDQMKFATSDTEAAKKEMAASAEKKAVAEGDLDVTSKELAEDNKALGTLHHDCMEKATDFESATKAKGEELKALATAKKIIKEATGAASAAASFVQVEQRTQLSSGADLAKLEAVRFVRDLARKNKSPALAQLAKRMTAAMRVHSGSADPFAKVKGLIQDMLAKLEKEAEADATEHAFCEKEMGESNAKKTELETEVEKLTTKIDQATSHSAQLKEEVATLQKELADMASSSAELTKIRQAEKAEFTENSAELKKGLDGIKTALKVLKDYYAANSDSTGAQGASGGIISLLEVCESDMSKGLAEATATEESAAAEYKSTMEEMEMDKLTKTKDVEYKTKEHVALDKTVSEVSTDRQGLQDELDAVLEYLQKLEGRCVAKPESYEEKKKRREAELAGLKEALSILESEAASLIQSSSKRVLRGTRKHQ